MFNFFTALISSITVEERNDLIIIKGIDSIPFMEDIRRQWGTRKITDNLFSYQKPKEIAFNKFFGIEFLYIIESLIQRRYTHTPNRVLVKIRDSLKENTWLSSLNEEVQEPLLDQSQLNQFVFKPKVAQQDFFNHLTSQAKKLNLRGYLLDSAPGTGKAQPLYTKLRTRQGFILNKDIQVGDKILAWSGVETTVKGVYPQGEMEVYEIEFSDGRKTRSCLEHLWGVYHSRWLGRRILSLAQILENNKIFNITSLSIDLPVCLNKKEIVNQLRVRVGNSNISGDDSNLTFKVVGEVEGAFVEDQLRQAGYIATHYKRFNECFVNGVLPVNPDDRKIKIKSIKKIGVEPVQCIEIDHPDKLYIADDWVVTHNTYMSLAVSAMLHSDTVIVVCPKNAIKDPWEVSIKGLFKKPKNYFLSTNENFSTVEKGIYVIHYEYLEKFLPMLYKTKADSLGEVTIILDECHNMNESGSTSNRTQNFIDLCLYINQAFVLWMSGTPLKAMGREVIPMLKTIDNLFNSRAEERFREIFGKNSSKANDIIAHRLGLVKFTITKESVITDKPDFHEYSVKLKDGSDYTLPHIKKVIGDFVVERSKYYKEHMDSYVEDYLRCLEMVKLKKPGLADSINGYFKVATTLRKNYDPRIHKTEPAWCNKFEKEFIIPYLDSADKQVFREARSVYKYVTLKIQGEALGRILGGIRTRCNLEIANIDLVMDEKGGDKKLTLLDMANASNSKTVFFTSFVQVVLSLQQQLTERGVKCHVVYADTNKNLVKILSDMRNNPDYTILVATYDSLSAAVPLTMCSTIIMLNAPFREYERTQTIARCARLGQTEQVDIYDIFLDTGGVDNISTRSKDILEWSKRQVEEIMGVKTQSKVSVESIENDETYLNDLILTLETLENIRLDVDDSLDAKELDNLINELKYHQVDVYRDVNADNLTGISYTEENYQKLKDW
ncbi:MAG: DEAD/DEAH box helicase family protein [Gammaproteobacteria bacterium]|nr:DEAD/DEAH box helicase family protein [Acholeplasmataceae bacterium]MCK9529011.1 DEAD/DEAH box helicase family protein [Gammaproteobacteria bacterium]